MSLVYESVLECETPISKYKSNKYTNISEPAVQVPICYELVHAYTQLLLNPHQNIVPVHDVYVDDRTGECTASIWNAHGLKDEFCTLENSLAYYFFDLFGTKDNINSLKVFLSDVFDGLAHLHKIGLYHGDLNLKTTHYYNRRGLTRPVFMLTGLKLVSGSDKYELMRKDLHAAGCLLENVLMVTNPVRFVEGVSDELIDLIKRLKSGDMYVRTGTVELVNAVTNPNLWKQFIFEHVGLLTFEDRPSFITSAVSFLETEGLISNVRNEDVMCLDQELEFDAALVPELLKKYTLVFELSKVPPDQKGWYYILTERNLLNHPIDPGSVVGRTIGTTNNDVDEYFISRSNVVLALYKAVRRTSFKFVSYDSQSHDVYRILHDKKVKVTGGVVN